MNRMRKLGLVVTGFALAAIPLLVAAQSMGGDTARQAKITGTTFVSVDELKWTPMADIPGAQMAAVFGDPAKEAHRVFFKFPAGLKAPVHTHTNGDRGVIISGTLVLTPEGGAAKKLPPGSYWSMAGGTKHTTSVDGDKECIFYIEREGRWDVVMAGEAGAKKEK